MLCRGLRSGAGRDGGLCFLYAHSLVCDPWGRVQAQAEAEPELLICDIDLSETDAVRAQLPVLRARRTDLYQLKYEKDS